jgi:MbtH protein
VSDEDEDDREYEVVVNGEEQYSIWPADLPCPDGWAAVGVRGAKPACLEHIDRVWTDMRPRSLREHMAAAAAVAGAGGPAGDEAR